MKKQKRHYAVYTQYSMDADEPEDEFEDEWRFAGDTYAVSEAQAINNVRHRTFGDHSFSLPLAVGGKWATWLDWKAEEIE